MVPVVVPARVVLQARCFKLLMAIVISGPATIHRSRALGFYIRLIAPSSPLTSTLFCSMSAMWQIFFLAGGWEMPSPSFKSPRLSYPAPMSFPLESAGEWSGWNDGSWQIAQRVQPTLWWWAIEDDCRPSSINSLHRFLGVIAVKLGLWSFFLKKEKYR